MPDPLITLDAAVKLAKEAGFVNMNRGWFLRKIDSGALDAKNGVVPYVSRADVAALIQSMLTVQNQSPA